MNSWCRYVCPRFHLNSNIIMFPRNANTPVICCTSSAVSIMSRRYFSSASSRNTSNFTLFLLLYLPAIVLDSTAFEKSVVSESTLSSGKDDYIFLFSYAIIQVTLKIITINIFFLGITRLFFFIANIFTLITFHYFIIVCNNEDHTFSSLPSRFSLTVA